MIRTTLATRLKTLRKRCPDLKADEVAAAVDISRAYLSSIENGHDLPGRAVLARLAAYYNTSLEFLLCGGAPPDSGELVEDLDELALLAFWRELDPQDRPTVLRLIGAAAKARAAA